MFRKVMWGKAFELDIARRRRAGDAAVRTAMKAMVDDARRITSARRCRCDIDVECGAEKLT